MQTEPSRPPLAGALHGRASWARPARPVRPLPVAPRRRLRGLGGPCRQRSALQKRRRPGSQPSRAPTLPPRHPWEPGSPLGLHCPGPGSAAEVRLGRLPGRGARRARLADNAEAASFWRVAGSAPATDPPGLGLCPGRPRGCAGPDGPRPAFWAERGAVPLLSLRASLRVPAQCGGGRAGSPGAAPGPAGRAGNGAGLAGRSGGLRKRARRWLCRRSGVG